MTAPRPEAKIRPFATIELSREVVLPLRKEAAARGTTVPALVVRLLDQIAFDGLTRAVLDD